MARKRLNIVTILCYGEIETMERKKAIEKYYQAMVCCEGSEKERYCNIYSQLVEGKNVCKDIE